LAGLLFEGLKLRDTLQDIIRGCELCQHNNSSNTALPAPGTQRWGTYPGEDWQLDFTRLPGGPTSRLLLVLVDTFTGLVEVFPCSSEKAPPCMIAVTTTLHLIVPTATFTVLKMDNYMERP
jgi:hypothetical protein